MKKILYLILPLTVICASCKPTDPSTQSLDTPAASPDTVSSRYIEYGLDVTDCISTEGRIRDGEVITSLLRRVGATPEALNRVLLLPDSLFNPRALRSGNDYIAYHSSDSARSLKYWVYSHSMRDYTIFDFTDTLTVYSYTKPVSRISRSSLFTIESSLWQAIDDADLNTNLALDISDIFAWTVDFFGLQKGDRFRVCYDELYVDSISIGIDSIHAASFTRDTLTTYAIYYADHDIAGYWELDGDNVKKAFLKAPLSFSRISSHFSYARRHPVYKTVRPHTGVDYAAPKGTPVMSIGDGVVVERGYKGGGGNTVKIRHNSTYTSAYLHLSRFGKDIAVGTRVVQGQIIGYVGSTGTSTGAHLDFRIWKNGTPIDPLKLESPPSEPIPASHRASFDSVASIMKSRLDSIH